MISKKIFVLLALMLLLVGTVSALDWDNIKSYDEVEREYTITNALGFGETLARIKLLTPLNVGVIDQGEGIYQKVAELEFKEWTKINGALNNIETYPAGDLNVELDREIRYKYQAYRDVNKDIYETLCEITNSIILGNGSTRNTESCSQVYVETIGIEEGYWVEFTDISELPVNPQGEPIGHIISLWADVKPNEKVEWVPDTWYGERLIEWATWTSSFNVDLLAYFAMNKTENFINDSVAENYSAACALASVPTVDGQQNNSRDFSSAGCNLPANSPELQAGNFTFSAWSFKTGNGFEEWLSSSTNFVWGSFNNGNLAFQTNGGLCAGWCQTTIGHPLNSWYHFVMTFNDNGTIVFYVNGTQAGVDLETTGWTKTAVITVGFGAIVTSGPDFLDEVAIWNRTLTGSEVTDLYNNGAGIFFNSAPIPADFTPGVELLAPVDNLNSTSAAIEFNYTCTDDFNVTNATLTMDDVINTTTIWGTSNDTGIISTPLNFAEGFHNWSVTCWDNASQSNASVTRSFTVDSIDPVVTILYPTVDVTDDLALDLIRELPLNWSSFDISLETCKFLNVTSGTNESIACGTNVTMFNSYDTYTFQVFANDTHGNEGLDEITVTYAFKILEILQSFNNDTLEGSSEFFQLNVTAGTSISSASLNYNGTLFPGSILNIAGDNFTVFTTIDIPAVTADEVHEFHWQLILSDSSQVNSTSNNQTVRDLGFDDCSANNFTILNYTLLDEESQALLDAATLNASIQVDVNILPVGSSVVITNFSKLYNNTNFAPVCLSINITSNSFLLESQVRYSAEEYASELHHIQNLTISASNIPQNINLFDLSLDSTTEFLIIFKDNRFIPVENALLNIQRKYISEGVFKSVEIPRTDRDGRTIAHVDLDTVIYTIVVTKGGEVLATFDNIIFRCQDEAAGQCQLGLNDFTGGEAFREYEEIDNLRVSFSFDEATREVEVIFLTIDGSSSTVVLNTTKYDRFQNTSVCSDSLTSSAGTLSCVVPDSFGNISIISNLFKDGDLRVTKQYLLTEDPSQIFAGVQVTMLIFLFTTIPLMLIGSTIATLFFFVIGLVIAVYLTLMKGGSIFITGSMIVWFAVAIGLVIWKIAKKEE